MTNAPEWMEAAAAVRGLGVTRATLYAYVSRGHIRSQAVPGAPRERRYAREDVERLRRRTEERRDPDKAAARALRWGLPVLESSITLIDGERLYYRGHDAVALARSRPLVEVASLIWSGRFDLALAIDTSGRAPAGSARDRDLPFMARAQSRLAHAAARDPLAFDLRPDQVARRGWRIVQLLTRTAAGSAVAAPTVEATLARAWRVAPRGVDVLRSALILCADHELNVSSFAARCVASTGATPYAVVMAGLAALEGIRHGGMSARVEAMLASLDGTRSLRRAFADRLRRGERIDGFGHPLYPHGDPRATALFELLRDRYRSSAELAFALEVAQAAGAALQEQPTIDFALAAVSRVLRLPAGSPLTLFAIGRSIGWVGHAIEQYATGQLIRPRAKYVGVLPA